MTTLDDVAITLAVALDNHATIAIAINVAANERSNGAADDGAGDVFRTTIAIMSLAAITIEVPISATILSHRET
jgi:hypothetical protein